MTYDRPTTPMMKQYFEVKDNYTDCILFYRLGDFYEMFFEDAVLVSKELEIALTGRDCGMAERAPMCGVPYHAAESYISKLISKGYKVAICEQVEDVSSAKGLVKREVIRIVTAGTNTVLDNLQQDKPNYLMSIHYQNNIYGIACADVLTGDFFVNEAGSLDELYDFIERYSPSEIICSAAVFFGGFDKDNHSIGSASLYTLDSGYYDDKKSISALLEQQKTASVEGLGISNLEAASVCAGSIILYLRHTYKSNDLKLNAIRSVKIHNYMIIDDFSRRNLELTVSLIDNQKKGSLLWILDKTKTAMGSRLLRSYLIAPLYDIDKIRQRQTLVEELTQNKVVLDMLRQSLSKIYDMDRLMGKILYSTANPKDMLAFRDSLKILPEIVAYKDKIDSDSSLYNLLSSIDELNEAYQLLLSSIDDEAPISAKDGQVIKPGYDNKIDELRSASNNGTNLLAQLEAKERQRTGIKTLKIKYNRVFGYCIEITNSYKDLVPSDYVRRQTMVNAERYVTDEVSSLGEMILGSKDKLLVLEYDIFCEIRDRIADYEQRLRKTTGILSMLDVFASFAYISITNRYVKPELNNDGYLNIKGGRHPVVEQVIKANSFIANDTSLDMQDNLIAVITGPNMAGKSTYMRQVALIVLMAHIGCFIPASKADIPLTDRIFTRVGASDDLASGKSTFMVEMTEVAHILKNATKNSLLILDEIGRGTGTIDGLSIAWAVIEYVSNRDIIGAKTLFATHYHELSELEGRLDGVRNYSIAVKEQADGIVFLRKILRGGVDKSYGIQVARLAGVPQIVTKRAEELLKQLNDNDLMDKIKHIDIENLSVDEHRVSEVYQEKVDIKQLSIFDSEQDNDIINEIKALSIESITPMEAMNILYNLRQRCKDK